MDKQKEERKEELKKLQKAAKYDTTIRREPLETNYEYFLKHFDKPEDYPLTEKQQEILQRYETINDLFKLGRPVHAIVKLIMKSFGLKKAQVYRDIEETQMFFVSIPKTNMDYRWNLLWDFAMSTLMRAISVNNLAMEIKAQEQLSKLWALKKDIAEGANWETMPQPKFEIHITLNDGRKITTDFENPVIEEADYEEVMKGLKPKKLSPVEIRNLIDGGA